MSAQEIPFPPTDTTGTAGIGESPVQNSPNVTSVSSPTGVPEDAGDIESRIGLLETERTWIVGLSAGVGIGIGLIIWLRRDIIRTLVQEAFPERLLWDQYKLNTWRPNRNQWKVLWGTSAVVSVLFVFLPFEVGFSIRLLLALLANGILLLFWLRDKPPTQI